ncbi:MAG TPA: UDP-glucose 4-epimerase GalE [Trebonia sp.]|nr:UDP-glucose 4-epimerase GalE [Trebonia sp.]
MKLLVTGGAGYIGSVVAAKLVAAGHQVTVLDDLSTGFAVAVPAGAAFVQGTLRGDAKAALGEGTDAVLHFAAHSQVGESVANPAKYWSNNLGGTLALLEAMRAGGTTRIAFSSTAAAYGNTGQVPIPETAPALPASPYGASKVAVDTALAEYARMHGFAAISLRYFNVAGALRDHAGTWVGERHDPESHLIPNLLLIARAQARGDTGAHATLFGTDYPTPDGTCVRDYIHVSDLADAHLLALDASQPGLHRVYNLGIGAGASVRQVIDACREVTGLDIPVVTGPRRAGDPASLIASAQRARADLGWRPAHDLRAMVADAWQFLQSTAP